jgi:hypothetical protein
LLVRSVPVCCVHCPSPIAARLQPTSPLSCTCRAPLRQRRKFVPVKGQIELRRRFVPDKDAQEQRPRFVPDKKRQGRLAAQVHPRTRHNENLLIPQRRAARPHQRALPRGPGRQVRCPRGRYGAGSNCVKVGDVHEGKTPNFRKGPIFEKVSWSCWLGGLASDWPAHFTLTCSAVVSRWGQGLY